jgi:site-specific recombinase XerD
MTVKELINIFLDDQRLRNNSPKTIKNYDSFLNNLLINYFNDDVDILTVEFIKNIMHALQNDKNLSSISVRTYCRHLFAFLRFSVVRAYLPYDFTSLKLPKATKPVIQILTDNERKTLFAVFDKTNVIDLRNCCVVGLMVDCGLRLNEAVTLRYDDVNFDSAFIKVSGKGDKERLLPLGSFVLDSLNMYNNLISKSVRYRDTFFLNDDNSPLTYGAIRLLFKRLKIRTKINRLHAHLLRHTFATNYIMDGGDVFSLQKLLGHTDIEMVRNYVTIANTYLLLQGKKLSSLDKLFK